MYKKIIRPILFSISKDPERAHHLALFFLKIAGIPPFSFLLSLFTKVEDKSLEQKVFGINFKNPVGLAAGFDKNGEVVQGLSSLGFGFIEVGTVTEHPQPGNPRPRLFRLFKDLALINRMGFNNKGSENLAVSLSKINDIVVGGNFGKSKITELKDAKADYMFSFKKLYEHSSYLVFNVSSPNTPGLRTLQNKEFLTDLISDMQSFRASQKNYKPILIKIDPDLETNILDEIIEVCVALKLDGIIATNTTLSREGLTEEINETGGLSGKPLQDKSTEVIKYIHKKASSLTIIGVGGIFTAEDAYEKIKAGASLVQVYTGMIYEGPFLVKKINKGLIRLLAQDGYKNISEIIK